MRAHLIPLVALAAFLTAAGPATSPIDVPEPDGLYEGAPQGYVPPTLKGAEVVDTPALERLIAAEKPVLIDVSLADRKPDNLPAGTIWSPSHRSIPGAVWLPEAGAAPLDPHKETALFERMSELTGGDKSKPVVVFCHPDCWGSWNFGKRLVGSGYTAVRWFPLGIEGWQEGHDTTVLRPDSTWMKASAASRAGEAQR